MRANATHGGEAARRKFSPEFINRFANIIVFKPVGTEELRQIVDIELKNAQQRIRAATGAKPFIVVAESAKTFLPREGTDFRYGARPLKRAIERRFVQTLAIS